MTEESDSDTELDTELANFRKLKNSMKALGFQEGAAKGREIALQDGFNAGYSMGYKMGEHIGITRALLRCEAEMEKFDEKKTNITDEELNEIIRQTCVFCNKKISDNLEKTQQYSYNYLISEQEEQNEKIISTIAKSHTKLCKQ